MTGRAEIYELERTSIRAFVESCPFAGRVLDFGAGLQPYRDIVADAGAEYVPYDRADMPGGSGGNLGPDLQAGAFDVVICTQVIQYVPDPLIFAGRLRWLLADGGALVATGPGCWHEEEPSSLWRFTRAGARALLEGVGFTVERLDDRGTLDLGGFPISVGWGAVARA